LVEASACGVPVCTTNFSSANEIIKQGINGYVVYERNIDVFVQFMQKSLMLNITNFNVSCFSVSTLKADILKKLNIDDE